MNIEHAKRMLAHLTEQEKDMNMLISAAFPGRYLKAEDLMGAPTLVTIKTVSMEQVARSGDPQPVVFFKEFQKGMVLNKTNSKSISRLYGDETTRWKGTQVQLYEAMVEYQGDVMPAIRIRPPKNVEEKAPWEDGFTNPVKLDPPPKLSEEAKKPREKKDENV